MLTLRILFVVCTLLAAGIRGQTVAILVPEDNDFALKISGELTEVLRSTSIKVLDPGLANAAYSSTRSKMPFNMTRDEAVGLGSVIGCNFIILVKAADLRRTSFEKNQYAEAFVAIYLVSSRTGRLVYWTLQKNEGETSEVARSGMRTKVEEAARVLLSEINKNRTAQTDTTPSPELKTPEDFANSKSFRAPIPFNRIKPEYTSLAYLYGAEGTVDIEVDIDAKGTVTRTEIGRWLGYGLDESVEKAVREMNWRPAELDGKPLAMRVLLRYNFRKIEKD